MILNFLTTVNKLVFFMKKNIFFVGAPKCGSSTMYEFFKILSDVSTQTPKETHFFSYPEVSNTYYDVKYIQK